MKPAMSSSSKVQQLRPSLGSLPALPPPRLSGGLPLMDALSLRHSARSFSPRPLSPQIISDLLWVAAGINRADSGGRTAPSARNWQEIEVYAAMADGVYRYRPRGHRVDKVLDEDIRADTGQQDFVAAAPLTLIYVADLRRIEAASATERRFYTAADCGFVAENVYLYCASEGLATVVRGLIDRPALASRMKLSQQQRVLLAQSIGYHAADG